MLSFGDDVGLLFLKPQMQADQMELVTQVCFPKLNVWNSEGNKSKAWLWKGSFWLRI